MGKDDTSNIPMPESQRAAIETARVILDQAVAGEITGFIYVAERTDGDLTFAMTPMENVYKCAGYLLSQIIRRLGFAYDKELVGP